MNKGVGIAKRRIAKTLLMVGEGDSECVLLSHLKSIYVVRGSGWVVSIKNARGKGAAHVVAFTIRQAQNAAFDVKAALIDTDTDWSEKVRAVARRARVELIASSPCVEAWLLAAHEEPIEGKSSARLKSDFAERFGGGASDLQVYRKHFSEQFLEQSRTRNEQLEKILCLLIGAL